MKAAILSKVKLSARVLDYDEHALTQGAKSNAATYLHMAVSYTHLLHIPYGVPMILGLVGGAMSFIPAGMGVFAYYFLNCVQRNAGFLADSSFQGDMLETIADVYKRQVAV